MTVLWINNSYAYHLEIIESIIHKHNEIIKKKANIIYLTLMKRRGNDDKEYDRLLPPFIKYITEKYTDIKIEKPNNYDYYIDVTLKPEHKSKIIDKDQNKYFYIAHEPGNELSKMKNVYWLTPFYKRFINADILPFADKINMNRQIPIYVIQGNKKYNKRDYNLLDAILSKKYNYKFIIRWAGFNKLPEKYKNKVEDLSGSFIEYHKHFLDCYCLIPLISKNKNSYYYSKKLTSSINYTKGYKLKCLIDKDLQMIYNLEDVELFNDKNDISLAFEKTLIDFYTNK